MYAIVGITGRVGSAVGENLLAQGEQIRAIVRDSQGAARWRDRGAEVAVADVHDSNALASAFEGMDGVFLMIPPNFAPAPGFPETRKTLASYHAALSKALPKKAVCLSSIGAEQASGLGLITSLHLLEQTLGDLPIPQAFLRAGWFMENHAADFSTARSEGRIFSNLFPLDRKFSLVAKISARPGPMCCGRNGREPAISRSPAPSSIPPTTLREHSARLSDAASKRLPFRARSGRNSSSARACRRAGQNLVPRWSMGSTQAGFISVYPARNTSMAPPA